MNEKKLCLDELESISGNFIALSADLADSLRELIPCF